MLVNAIDENSVIRGLEHHSTLAGHTDLVHRIAWSPDGQLLASGSRDSTIRIWDVRRGQCLREIDHAGWPRGVAWSPDGHIIASGGLDDSVRLWDADTGGLISKLLGHMGMVNSVSWSPDGELLASGSWDQTVRLWNPKTGALLETMTGHTDALSDLAWSPDGRVIASSSWDRTIHLWDAASGTLIRTLIGHTHMVHCVAWHRDMRLFASGANDNLICLWDPQSGRQVYILEGHTDAVTALSFTYDGRLLASKSRDNTIKLWRCDTWETVCTLHETADVGNCWTGLAFCPTADIVATVGRSDTMIHVWGLDLSILLGKIQVDSSRHYINAKVILVGESGVGKSALGTRIAEGTYRPTEGSTHGAQFWQIPVSREIQGSIAHLPDTDAELTLWDLAGQPDYHLVHQLFLDDTHVALLLFDCSDQSDPFRGVPYWAKVLRKQAPSGTLKLLVSARIDVSPVTAHQTEITRILTQYELDAYVRTSAKTGDGVDMLVRKLLEGISWDKLPRITTPRLFQVIRDQLLASKGTGKTAIPMDELRRAASTIYTEPNEIRAEVSAIAHSLPDAEGGSTRDRFAFFNLLFHQKQQEQELVNASEISTRSSGSEDQGNSAGDSSANPLGLAIHYRQVTCNTDHCRGHIGTCEARVRADVGRQV